MRIYKRKLAFYHHLLTLDKKSLASKIADIQYENNYPGLITECKWILATLGLSDCDPSQVSKQSWKKMIKDKIRDENKRLLLVKFANYKKMNISDVENEESSMKSYMRMMNLQECRTKFALRTKQLRSIKMNQSSNNEFSDKLWSCDNCLEEGRGIIIENQIHTLICPSYATLREGIDLNNDLEVVRYFQAVLKET